MIPLGINIRSEYDASLPAQVKLLAGIGFRAFFVVYLENSQALFADCRKAADDNGVTWETIHAPFWNPEGGVNTLWMPGAAGDRFLGELMHCVDACAENHVGIMVCHTSISSVIPEPSELGGRRFDKLVAHAASAGVKLAFENLEFAKPLRFVLRRFQDNPAVGLCWDIGHQNCFTPEHDVMGEFGHRILCVHIHDNLGKRREGIPDYEDDLHLLPFDGTIDYAEAGRRLRASLFASSLMLEVKPSTSLDRGTSTSEFDSDRFFREAYKRSERLSSAMGYSQASVRKTS